jgi:DNA primase DnaG DnaB-binding/DnaB-helicase binding domain of primase
LTELSSRHPPINAEGGAALVAAALPLLATITAPILGTLMRRQLAEISGLSEDELPPLLARASGASELPRRSPTGTARNRMRRAPSLARELIQWILLQPDLARSAGQLRSADGTPEGNALAALVETCAASEVPLSTGAVMQSFASSVHEPVLAAALATAEDQSLTIEHAEARVREGIERWWLWARRDGRAAISEGSPADGEEAERLRQLEYVRRMLPGNKHVEPSGGAG